MIALATSFTCKQFPFGFNRAVLVAVEVGSYSVRIVRRAYSGGHRVATWLSGSILDRNADAYRAGGSKLCMSVRTMFDELASRRADCRPQPSHVAPLVQRRGVTTVLDRDNHNASGSFRRNLSLTRCRCCPLLIDVNSKKLKEFNAMQVAFLGGRA